MRSTLILLLLFIASSATAQTCDVVPTFIVSPNSPVLLIFRHSTPYLLGNPIVRIDGTQITIHQARVDVPPPPGTPEPPRPCNSRTVSLGVLPPGTYSVTWNYSTPSGVPGGGFQPFETFHFAFSLGSIPALDGGGLLGLMFVLGILGVLVLRR
ncbi:MAG TPA: hypothetical protein VEU30_15465 [Thermoanaerobaculia bacterium]|nr:hypothetical protein [Thermoanaerobaculia bacterium]